MSWLQVLIGHRRQYFTSAVQEGAAHSMTVFILYVNQGRS